MVFFIAFFTLLHMPIFAKPIEFYDTLRVIIPFVNSCTVNLIPNMRDPFRYYTLCFSAHVLGNVYWVPLVSMAVLLLLVFLLIKKFTGSITYSLFGVLLITLANSFGYYAFSATYDQTWVALLFGSIYLLTTKYRYVSIIPFTISLGFRGLPLLDMPIIIAMISMLEIPKKQKIILSIGFICVAIAAIVYTEFGGIALTQAQQITFDLSNGFEGIKVYRMDIIFYLSSIPLGYMLYTINTKYSNLILFSITYLIFQVFYLSAFTNLGQEPYRMFPLLIFIAVGYGYSLKILLIKREKIEAV